MCEKINAFFVKTALKIVDRKKGPDQISVSEGNDFLYAHVFKKSEGIPELWFQEFDNNTPVFLKWDGSRFSQSVNVDLVDLDPSKISYEHWYGNYKFQVRGTIPFIFYHITGGAWFATRRDRLNQVRYNRSTVFLEERHEILRKIVETSITLAINANSVSAFTIKKSSLDWFFTIYGHRAVQHPNYSIASLRFRAVLDGLHESGELSLEDHRYFGTGKAMTSLSDYELENRRYRNAHSLNRLLVVFTSALVIVGSIQALVTYFG